MIWENEQLVSAEIRSDAGRPLRLRTGEPVQVREGDEEVVVRREAPAVVTFQTRSGSRYIITPETP